MAKHSAVTTQSQHPWRATIRTILAVVVALSAMAPSIYSAATQGSPEAATGAAALALGIAAAITRIMALPGVEAVPPVLVAAPALLPHRARCLLALYPHRWSGLHQPYERARRLSAGHDRRG